MIASIRIAWVWSLYQRRKVLRIRQRKTEERQTLKLRMKKRADKAATMGAVALKRFRRVRLCEIPCLSKPKSPSDSDSLLWPCVLQVKGPGSIVFRRMQAAKKIQRWVRK